MLNNELVRFIIQQVGLLIEYIGLAMVVVFVFISLWNTVKKEYTMEHVRHHLAKRVIFGLEFIIAADILLATVATDFEQIVQLGAIVLIRVVLGYSLRQEAKEMKKK